jgi:hypothetical protein
MANQARITSTGRPRPGWLAFGDDYMERDDGGERAAVTREGSGWTLRTWRPYKRRHAHTGALGAMLRVGRRGQFATAAAAMDSADAHRDPDDVPGRPYVLGDVGPDDWSTEAPPRDWLPDQD